MSGLRHVVLARFDPGTTATERAAVLEALAALPSAVPEIRALRLGTHLGSGPNAYDLAVVMDFDDVASFRRYIASEAHAAYVTGPGRAIAELAVVQHA